MSSAPAIYTERFQQYFSREVAQKAAKSLSNGVEMEFQIQSAATDLNADETFTFTKTQGRNQIVAGPAKSPQVRFTLTLAAADHILADPSEEIGQIGVNIAKMILSGDAGKKVSFKIHAGFLSLMTQGYFGVVTAGGAAFASFLASHGLNGLGAIKAAFKKLKH